MRTRRSDAVPAPCVEPAAGSPCLRADAARNRRLLVDAARVVFVERGLDASFDEIARRAGLGNATLYRHFPQRSDLIGAVFVETMRGVVVAAERAEQVEDPWYAFAGYVEFLCGVQAGDRALADLITTVLPGLAELDELRARAFAAVVRLIERAQAAGVLRPDFGHQDLVLLLMANAGLVRRTADDLPDAWRRHLGYVLAGLRSAHPVADGPTVQDVEAAMIKVPRHDRC